jgi:hypothetical protein
MFVTVAALHTPIPIAVAQPTWKGPHSESAHSESAHSESAHTRACAAQSHLDTVRRTFDALIGNCTAALHWKYQVMSTVALAFTLRQLSEFAKHSGESSEDALRVAAAGRWLGSALCSDIAPLRRVAKVMLLLLDDGNFVQHVQLADPVHFATLCASDHSFEARSETRFDRMALEFTGQGAMELLGKVLEEPGLWPNTFYPLAAESGFSLLHARLFERLIRAQPALMAPLGDAALRAVNDEDERTLRERHVGAAEFVAGCAVALSKLRSDESEVIRSVFVTGCAKATPETSAAFNTAIRFAVSHSAPDSIEWLVRAVVASLWSGTSAATQAKSIEYVKAVLAEQNVRCTQTAQLVSDQLIANVAHEYKQVRQQVGQALGLLIAFTSENSAFGARQSSPLLHALLARLDAAKSADATTLSRTRETLLETVVELLLGRQHAALSEQFARIHAEITEMQQDPEQELSLAAKKNILLLTNVVLRDSARIREFLSSAEALSNNAAWHVRAAVLPFLQLFMFNHAYLAQDCAETCLRIVQERMRDTQPEVKELAMIALSSLLRGSFPEHAEQLTRAPLALLVQRLPAKSNPAYAEALSARHAAALTLAAVLQSFPYSVPSFMPAVCVALADASRDPQPLKDTVHKALGEFWRTHYDQWHSHFKQLFNEAQLSALSAVSSDHLTYIS